MATETQIKAGNLWLANRFTSVPNNILGMLCKDRTICVRTRIIIAITRLSFGFRKSKTNTRLCIESLAHLINADPASVSRQVRALIQEERLFKSDSLGQYAFYSLLPTPKHCKDAIPDCKNAILDCKNAMSSGGKIANMQTPSNNLTTQNIAGKCFTMENNDVADASYMLEGSKPAYKSLNKSIKGRPLFITITPEQWTLLEKAFDIVWLEERLLSYSARLTKGSISFDRLKIMLKEDSAKIKPARNYDAENAEQKKKLQKCRETQEREAGQPDPPELIEWREKNKQTRGKNNVLAEAST